MAVGRMQRDRRIAVVLVTIVAMCGLGALVARLPLQPNIVAIALAAALLELVVVVPVTLAVMKERSRRAARKSHPATHTPSDTSRARKALIEAVGDAMNRDGSVAIALFDLDGFKLVNAGFGHDVGDHVISTMHTRIAESSGENTMVFHLGGDEFGVVLNGPIGLLPANDQARYLTDIIAEPLVIVGVELAVTTSVGVALGAHGDSPAGVLDHASMAVHRAKQLGGRRVVLYDDALRTEARDRLALSAALNHAVDRNELVIEFQTVNRLTDDVPIAVEALVRWKHPIHGLLPPERFIPLAEEIGAIGSIGRWVLKAACRELSNLDAALGAASPSQVWVNVSPRQLESLAIVDDVGTALRLAGIKAERLVIEVTESTLISDTAGVAAILDALKSTGVTVAVDDFGTGFSALAYLDQLPLDILKIDRQFIAAIHDNTSNTAIVSSVITMGHEKGLTVIAEGVETLIQRDVLRSFGCDAAQGWFYGRPTTSADMVRRISSRNERLHSAPQLTKAASPAQQPSAL